MNSYAHQISCSLRPGRAEVSDFDDGARNGIEHLANEAPLLRTGIHRLVREHPTEARISIVRPEMQHRKYKRLDDQFEPPVKVGLAHCDRESDQTLFDDRRNASLEDRAIEPLLRAEMIADQRHRHVRGLGDLAHGSAIESVGAEHALGLLQDAFARRSPADLASTAARAIFADLILARNSFSSDSLFLIERTIKILVFWVKLA